MSSALTIIDVSAIIVGVFVLAIIVTVGIEVLKDYFYYKRSDNDE